MYGEDVAYHKTIHTFRSSESTFHISHNSRFIIYYKTAKKTQTPKASFMKRVGLTPTPRSVADNSLGVPSWIDES